MPVNAAGSVRQDARTLEVLAPEIGVRPEAGGGTSGFPSRMAPPVTSSTSTSVEIGGRVLLSFGGCDYLGLAHHPAVLAAAREAMGVYGLSTTASRVTTGNTAAHNRLEDDVSRLLGQPAAVLVPEGYTANLALAQALARRVGVAVIDERAHRSLPDAAVAGGLRIVRYAHLDAGDAARRLGEIGREPAAILTDGVFTADGAVAPVRELLNALRTHDDLLVVDDCHGVGVLAEGRGTCRFLGVSDPRIVLTTTLAKGIGCYGGAVAGQAAVVDEVRRHATAFICTTPVPPAIAAAASAAIRVLEHDRLRHVALAANAGALRAAVRSLGVGVADQPTPIVAFAMPDQAAMERLHNALMEEGILAPLIRYPGGPAERYFRLTVTAEHTAEQIERLREAMARLIREALGATR